jgi:hypothetical protein
MGTEIDRAGAGLPASPGEITPQWLSAALQVDVRACSILAGHEGTTGRAELALVHDAGEALPSRLFVKLPPSSAVQQAFVLESGMGAREVRFYCHAAAGLPLRVPRCYFAGCSDDGSRYILLLEHLGDSGCRFRPSTQYSLDWVRRVVCALAALHAHFWESPRFAGDLAWLEGPPFSPMGSKLLARALATHGDELPPLFRQLGDLYLSETAAIHRLWGEGPATLQHGDPHDGNQFLDGEHPGFLDWGVVARGPGMRDIGYFLAGTLRPEHRVLVPQLLSLYRDELLSAGVGAPPASEELWQQYQWHAFYVWVSCACTLGAGERLQPSSFVLAALERLHPTLAAHGVADAVMAALGS